MRLILAEDVVIVGFRDAEEQAQDGSQPLPGSLLALDLAVVRAAGALAAAERAVAHLTRPAAPEHFWVHVDAHVRDDAVMPAVDHRQPGGLTPDEPATVLAVAVATGRVAEVEVTIYNPARDPNGTAGAALTGALARGLGATPPHPPSRPHRQLGRSSKQAWIRSGIVPLARPAEKAGTRCPPH